MGKDDQVFSVERSAHLDSILRRWTQNPKKILEGYVKEGMTVLDIGCGTGYFSIPMAEMVGETGRIIAVDLQEGMLDKLRNRITNKDIERRIELRKNEADSIGVTDKADFVLAFYLLHEVPNPKEYLEEIFAVLKMNGKFLLVEPRSRVSKKSFEDTERTAFSMGFSAIERPRISRSRAILFGKHE